MNVRALRIVVALSLAAATCVALPTAHAKSVDKPIVHLVAIGDLDVGEDFGQKVVEDARNIVATFEDAFAKVGKADQLRTRLMIGEEVTPAKVLNVIAKLDVRSNDAVVVLYSGHGAMWRGNEHVLTFHHGNLTRARLLAAMKAKAPRLNVLLTDCCSSVIAALSVVPRYDPKPMKAGDVMEWDTVSSLFLRHSGMVDLSAAEPGFGGRLDRVKSGSLFTNALVRVLKTPHRDLIRHLDRDSDGQLQWDEVLPQLRGLAAEYDRQQYGVANQQAYATSLGRWMPVTLKTGR